MAAAPGRSVTVQQVLIRVGAVLIAIAATASVYAWAHEHDPHCEAPPGPLRTVAIRFAGTPARVGDAARACTDGAAPARQVERDRNVLARDVLFVLGYTAALATACRLGNRLVRREVTYLAGRRLAHGAVAMGALNLLENALLWFVVRDLAGTSPLLIGTLTALAVTRSLVLIILLAYALGGLGAGLGVVVRATFGDLRLPQFDRPLASVTTPTREMGARLEETVVAEAAPGAHDRAGPVDPAAAAEVTPIATPYLQRFRSPDGEPWRAGDPDDDDAAVGVCFSGGGIRAASYALGALQVLQEKKALPKVRYLATVSGGGYTGMAWQIATRAAFDDPVPLCRLPASNGHAGLPPLGKGSPEAAWIQENARFLWPPVDKAGWWRSTLTFLSVAWAALRGIVFNAGLLLTLLFVVSRPLGWMTRTWTFGGLAEDTTRPFFAWQLAALAMQVGLVVLLAWPVFWRWWRKMAKPGINRMFAGVATTLGAACFTWMVLLTDHGIHPRLYRWTVTVPVGWCFVFGGIAIFALWAHLAKESAAPGFGIAIIALGIGKLWLDGGFRTGPSGPVELHALNAVLRSFAVLAGALGLLAVLRMAVHPGKTGERGPSLLAFWSLLAVAVAATIGAVAIVLPRSEGWSIFVALPPLLAIAYTARLVWRLREMEPFLGGPVNTARFVVAVVTAFAGAILITCAMWVWRPINVDRTVTDFQQWAVLTALLLVVFVFVDQKWWSPHEFYKRRLAGTFGPVRSADGPDGELTASALPIRIRTTLSTWARRVDGNPELLLCAAAYDTERIRPDENQALPFVFSADYVGSADLGFVRSCDFDAALGEGNEQYGTLRAAATISGAAVSPALGAVRLASLTQIMAFFNLRLGVWLPSPASINELRGLVRKEKGYTSTLPWVKTRRLSYLLKELVGRYDTEDRFLYVTDGGQFENLGLYELLVRRCHAVYAFDASADKGTVKSLLHSMRMAHDRLGVDFGPADVDEPLVATDAADLSTEWRLHLLHDLCAKPARPGWPGERESVAAVVTFRAWYPAETKGGDRTFATVVYSQARLARNTKRDLPGPEVRDYAALDPKFPNNSTGDQFIDEAQFVAYVHLGRWAAAEALSQRPLSAPPAPAPPPVRTGANGDGPAPARPRRARNVPRRPDG